jgi:hypothetical protein
MASTCGGEFAQLPLRRQLENGLLTTTMHVASVCYVAFTRHVEISSATSDSYIRFICADQDRDQPYR